MKLSMVAIQMETADLHNLWSKIINNYIYYIKTFLYKQKLTMASVKIICQYQITWRCFIFIPSFQENLWLSNNGAITVFCILLKCKIQECNEVSYEHSWKRGQSFRPTKMCCCCQSHIIEPELMTKGCHMFGDISDVWDQ